MSIEPDRGVGLAVAILVACVVALIGIAMRSRSVLVFGLLGVILSQCVPQPLRTHSHWNLARIKRAAKDGLISSGVGAAAGLSVGAAVHALVAQKNKTDGDPEEIS